MINLNKTKLIQTSVTESIQPLLADIPVFKRFKGCYQLIECNKRIDAYGKIYWIIKLFDFSSTVQVYCFNMNNYVKTLQPNSIVHIEATLKQVNGHRYVRCAFLEAY
ncbi:OB-fold nucleic acid binding domain-containing protein [Pseudocolwellia sp. HL-MZ19]|uniref:OB-fold nucleic acid binding domain-containing protein n=1 Tax=unclassified Pseudocolwellia TaxID=2848178 RepID=UPI003CF6FF3B